MHLEPLFLSQIICTANGGMQGIPNFGASVSKTVLVCSCKNFWKVLGSWD